MLGFLRSSLRSWALPALQVVLLAVGSVDNNNNSGAIAPVVRITLARLASRGEGGFKSHPLWSRSRQHPSQGWLCASSWFCEKKPPM